MCVLFLAYLVKAITLEIILRRSLIRLCVCVGVENGGALASMNVYHKGLHLKKEIDARFSLYLSLAAEIRPRTRICNLIKRQ